MSIRLFVSTILVLASACSGRRTVDQHLPETALWGLARLVAARHSHSASYDLSMGGMLVFGGVGADDLVLFGEDPTRVLQFDGVGTPPPRHGHAMVYDPVRRVHWLFGGVDRAGALRADTWRWDGSNWRQLVFADAPSARAYHAMAYDPVRRRVLLFGGVDAQGFAGDTWTFDDLGWNRLSTPVAPLARAGHALASTRAGVVLFGGSAAAELLADTWLFDGAAWQRQSVAGPAARVGHSLGAVRDGVLMFGGRGQVAFDDTWVLRNGAWQRLDIVGPAARWLHACGSDGESVWLAGGDLGQRPSSELWRFTNDTWTQVWPEQHPGARYDAAMTQAGAAALLFGGLRDTSLIAPAPLLDDTWLHGETGWTRIVGALAPPARSGAALAAQPGARVGAVLFGGQGVAGVLGDTWTFADDRWTQVTGPGPSARVHAVMAYHPGSRAAVLFGGRDASGLRADTWLFDGAAWRELAIEGPPARDLSGLALDNVSGTLLLFGGADAERGDLGDTWTFDGRAWQEVTTLGRPSARRHAALAALRDDRGVLLYGGFSQSPTPFTDLEWRWDGSGWRRVELLRSPGARVGPGLAHVPGTGLLLFGGLREGQTAHDSWFHSEPAIALGH